jgi:undecaprenyl-diphosphatase
MFHWLIDFDKKALLYLNGIHSPAWDNVMWWISGSKSWIPLYIVLLILIIYRERPYRFIFTILFIAITVVLCDQISVLIKNLVERPRPTHDSEIASMVHIVNNYKGGMYGFVSSHAANCFGIATFLANQFKHYKWSLFLFVWAAVVSYSRICLGVHYPLDIICGGVLGMLTGIQCYMFKVRTVVYIERHIEIRKEKRAKRRSQKSDTNRHK